MSTPVAQQIEDLCIYIPEKERPEPKDFVKVFENVELEWRSSAILEYNSYRMLPVFRPSTIKRAYEDWIPNKGDVIISTFHKTGQFKHNILIYTR